jgi:hypothetical protein
LLDTNEIAVMTTGPFEPLTTDRYVSLGVTSYTGTLVYVCRDNAPIAVHYDGSLSNGDCTLVTGGHGDQEYRTVIATAPAPKGTANLFIVMLNPTHRMSASFAIHSIQLLHAPAGVPLCYN